MKELARRKVGGYYMLLLTVSAPRGSLGHQRPVVARRPKIILVSHGTNYLLPL